MNERGAHHTDFDYLKRNQDAWDVNAAAYVDAGRRNWATEPTWGMFDIPETELGLLETVRGSDVVELGCGTGYVSSWIARRGGRPIGVDPTPNQLANARRFQTEFGVSFPLVRGAGEQVPLRDACCDLVISEYGAAIWSDPYRWIPEAARLLRPGGELIFLGNGTMLMLCVPDEDGEPAENWMRRPYFGMHRFEWPDDPGVEFHLGYGDWIRVLRDSGFVVEDLIELRPAESATTRYEFVTTDWARQWPAEEVWRARKS
jgi:SAM-dependent methyltransferase